MSGTTSTERVTASPFAASAFAVSASTASASTASGLAESVFTEHTIDSAPAAARRLMTATRNHLGYLPAGMARMAASPQLVDGFLKLTAVSYTHLTLPTKA